jgi:hypothetical protein
MKKQDQPAECCPDFDPKAWNEKEFDWKNKLFIRGTMPQFMHMPLPGTFSRTVARIWMQIEAAGGNPDARDFLMLASETSPWKGEVFINSTVDVPEAENIRLSGKFLTKVYDGPYNAVPAWVKDMDSYLAKKGKSARKYYFYYTTCPKCAKSRGHNYVVAFAEV